LAPIGNVPFDELLSHHEDHEGHEGFGYLVFKLRALRVLRGEMSFSTLVAVQPRSVLFSSMNNEG
jgi:hypothetical protein